MKILLVANSSIFLIKFKMSLIQSLSLKHNIIVAPELESHDMNQYSTYELTFMNYHINRRGINPIDEFRTISDLYKIVSNVKPDIVLSFTIKPNIYTGLICRLLNINNIRVLSGLGSAFNKGFLLKLIAVYLYRLSSSKNSLLIFENRSIMDYFLDKKIGYNHMCINGSGVDLVKFEYQDYPNNAKLQFLYVGRIMKEKGIYELIKAFENIHNLGHDFKLKIIGSIEESIDLNSHDDWLEYLGYMENIENEYKSCDALVFPSFHEGMPNVVLEASAVGRPCLVSDIPGCKDIIDDGYNGLLFVPKDSASLEAAVVRFMNLSSNRREKMGINARLKVEEFYNRITVDSIYSNLIENYFTNSDENVY